MAAERYIRKTRQSVSALLYLLVLRDRLNRLKARATRALWSHIQHVISTIDNL